MICDNIVPLVHPVWSDISASGMSYVTMASGMGVLACMASGHVFRIVQCD